MSEAWVTPRWYAASSQPARAARAISAAASATAGDSSRGGRSPRGDPPCLGSGCLTRSSVDRRSVRTRRRTRCWTGPQIAPWSGNPRRATRRMRGWRRVSSGRAHLRRAPSIPLQSSFDQRLTLPHEVEDVDFHHTGHLSFVPPEFTAPQRHCTIFNTVDHSTVYCASVRSNPFQRSLERPRTGRGLRISDNQP